MLQVGAKLAIAAIAGAAVALSAVPALALDVVVTIKPLHALVARVMGDTGVPYLLIQGAQSPHTYALKPSDVSRLSGADVFFRMSEAMEPFTARIVRALPGRVQVVTLEEAPRLQLLERRSGALFENGNGGGHGDGHDDGSDNDHDRSHGHAHGATDGHAWLDPVNAKAIVDRIAEALAAKEPALASVFRANAARLRSDLDALSAVLARELAPVLGKPYVVFHDALQYFERRYGLQAMGAIAVSPEVPPGARRLTALRRQIVERGAECVLAEPQFDTRLVQTIAEGTPARVGTIDPEGARIEPGPDHYFALLRALARDLRACLAPTG